MHSPRILLTAVLALAPAALAAPAAAAAAAGPGGTPYPRPAVCVDQATVLDADTCARVTRVLEADERATSDEIGVVVIRSTGGVPIETWGTGLFNAWGVGKRDTNNGVLLVVASDDRWLRIVTGSGLTHRLSDGAASEIVAGTITPLFREGRTRDGVLAGLDEIRRHLGHHVTADNQLADPNMAPVPAVADPPPGSDSDSSGLIIVALIAVLAGGTALWRWRTGQPIWGGDSTSSTDSGSSGSSFGGGSSSGGGASGKW